MDTDGDHFAIAQSTLLETQTRLEFVTDTW